MTFLEKWLLPSIIVLSVSVIAIGAWLGHQKWVVAQSIECAKNPANEWKNDRCVRIQEFR